MINTVLGRIKNEELGKTVIHEHIYCGSPDLFRSLGDRWFDRGELICASVAKLKAAKEKYGLCTVVDGTPSNLGRDISILKEVSEKSGVNIVASCGLYYGEEGYMNGIDPEYLSDLFADECKNGSENTYKTDSPILPGILKAATGYQGFTHININSLVTMARTQAKTGLALFSHNEHHLRTAHRQLDIFEANGADLNKVIVGHASDCQDIDYLESILDRGVYLGFDRIRSERAEVQADTLTALLNNGWHNRILLSTDGGTFVQFGRLWERERDNPYNAYSYIVNEFCEKLKSLGVSENKIDSMIYENPQNVLDI